MTDAAIVHSVDIEGPATHVFLAGIADYPHLLGGTGETTQWSFQLGQLTSTSASARALADWFIAHFDCAHKPLKTVSLLLSEPGADPSRYTNPTTGEIKAVPRGTRVDVRNALKYALDQVESAEDQFIFYFGGHGVTGGVNDFYLLRDHGCDPAGPLENMINCSEFLSAMRYQRPTYQLLLFDGCRDVSEVASANENGGSGMVTSTPAMRLGLGPVTQCSIHSAQRDAKAYGKSGQPSVSAQAFLRAISGAGGKRSKAGWSVTSARLCEAMNDFQTLGFGPHAGLVQKLSTTAFQDFPVRGLKTIPKAPVFMRRLDGVSLAGASVKCRVAGEVVHEAASIAEAYWEGLLDIGPHEFEVVMGNGQACQKVEDTVILTHLPIDLEPA